jgi:adenine-specific DNA-methyltransferase
MSMAAIDRLESNRLELQSALDSSKTKSERNRLGQFATPPALAADIMEYMKLAFPPSSKVHFLDPAFGTGSFYSALLRAFPEGRIDRACGYEIDPHYARKAVELWGKTSLDLKLADFTRAAPPAAEEARANLLICNPPYVRHHHLAVEDKQHLRKSVERAAGVTLSGLAGLYCYFMCLAPAWLAKGGLSGWLVPSEFMDVNYGRQVKIFLLDRVTLLRVHRFDPRDVQFQDALVSSAVVWFRNAPPPKNHTVEFSYGGTLTNPGVLAKVTRESLRGAPKWTRFPLKDVGAAPQEGSVKLSDLFTIKRGLATGANEFFILTPQQVREHMLPAEFLTPILPGPRYLATDEVNGDREGTPVGEPKLYLLSCGLPEAEVKRLYPPLWRYLQRGVRAGINERYLCRHRSPWYSQENRPPAPLLCTYMGRSETRSGRPFRFILNNSKATVANVYLMLYPKPIFYTALGDSPDPVRSIWQYLNQVSLAHLTGEGREYGGGLHKIEPRELGNMPLDRSIVTPTTLLPLLDDGK